MGLLLALSTILSSVLIVGSIVPGQAQDIDREPVMFVIDASGSMGGDAGPDRGDPSKIQVARSTLRSLSQALPADAPVGLTAYGHRPDRFEERACEDIEVLAPVGGDRDELVAGVDALRPGGETPIGEALRAAVEALPGGERASVVLVSDGIDTCAPPNACRLADELAGDGTDVEIQTIGFRVDDQARDELRCIADAGGGAYFDAEDADELADALARLVLSGERISGGRDAEDAPLLDAGRYRDDIVLGSPRWYAVEVPAGQRLQADAVLANDRDGPVSEVAVASLQVRQPDLVGDLRCDAASTTGVGARPVALDVEGAQARRESGLCEQPGRQLIRLELASPDDEDEEDDALFGVELPVQLTVSLSGSPTAPPDAAAPPQPEAAPEPPGALPPATGPAPTTAVLPAVVAAVLGLAAGGAAARWYGP